MVTNGFLKFELDFTHIDIISDADIIQHGIPHIIHFGNFIGYKVLITTKTGPTISDMQNRLKNRKLKLKSICKIAIQAVS